MIKTVLQNLSIWIIVLPFVAGIINYRGLNRDSRWIFFLVVAALLPQLMSFNKQAETNLLNLAYNLYTVVEFFILYRLLRQKFYLLSYRKMVDGTCILFAILLTLLFIRTRPDTRFLNELVCAANLLYMVWILALLKEQYTSESVLLHKKAPFTWYLLAILIYAPCTLVVFALYYYIRDTTNPVRLNLWIIQSIYNIILYLLFAIGLYIPRQKNIK